MCAWYSRRSCTVLHGLHLNMGNDGVLEYKDVIELIERADKEIEEVYEKKRKELGV